jgi:ABC-2 type transport system permease protein
MIKSALFLVRLFKIPIEWLGADYAQLMILLNTKLTLDFRNGPSAFQMSGRKKQTFGTQLFFYAVYGLLMAAITYSISDLLISLSMYFTVLMVMLAMTIISEFTTVIFDSRDNNILLPRPLNHRTLLLSRLIHIQFYIGYIALILSVAPGIVVAVKYNGLAFFIYFLAVGLSIWLTLIFTTFIYLLISKTVEGERFKDIITYAQVIMGILIFAGYQLLPRVMDANILNNSVMTFHWWTYLYPPVWFAALVRISLLTGITNQVLLLSILAVVLPVTGAILLIRFMSKGFENILGEAPSENAAPVKLSTVKRERLNHIKAIFCISETEKAGWDLAVATTGRDRKFKQSVYPYFGIMIVLAIVILRPDLKNLSASLHELNGFNKFFFITMIGFAGSIAVTQLPYTDTPEAAWIYTALPLKEHAHILSGAVKAMLVRYCLPAYLVVTVPALWLWGLKTLPQILLGGFGIVLLILFTLIIQKMELPFTQIREMQKKGTNSLIAIFNMILIGLLAGLLYLTSLISVWIACIICLVVAGLIVLFFRVLRTRKYSLSK